MRKYDQLVLSLKEKMTSGEYHAGMKIPSIRHLAAQYALSKSTVIKALDTLEREHLLYSVERSGYYVVKTKQLSGKEDSTWIDFASSAPDPVVFPYVDFQHCINQAIDLYQNDLFISLDLLGEKLDGLGLSGLTSIFILTQPSIVSLGYADHIKSELTKKGITSEISTAIKPEPTEENIEEVFQTFLQGEHDAIIGIGGGSVLDAAKILAVLKTNDEPISALVGTNLVKRRGVPTILIPTTSGTGSEVTPNAIVTFPEKELKIGMVSPHLLPDLVILDPALTLNLPKAITAATGMDAFTHALESYISNKSNPVSIHKSYKASYHKVFSDDIFPLEFKKRKRICFFSLSLFSDLMHHVFINQQISLDVWQFRQNPLWKCLGQTLPVILYNLAQVLLAGCPQSL
nr:iron-containing alcohol dehydrogenase [Bacillus subtilis]